MKRRKGLTRFQHAGIAPRLVTSCRAAPDASPTSGLALALVLRRHEPALARDCADMPISCALFCSVCKGTGKLTDEAPSPHALHALNMLDHRAVLAQSLKPAPAARLEVPRRVDALEPPIADRARLLSRFEALPAALLGVERRGRGGYGSDGAAVGAGRGSRGGVRGEKSLVVRFLQSASLAAQSLRCTCSWLGQRLVFGAVDGPAVLFILTEDNNRLRRIGRGKSCSRLSGNSRRALEDGCSSISNEHIGASGDLETMRGHSAVFAPILMPSKDLLGLVRRS